MSHSTMYDVLVRKNDNYVVLAANTKRKAIEKAAREARSLAQDKGLTKWSVKVMSGPRLLWQDSSRSRSI